MQVRMKKVLVRDLALGDKVLKFDRSWLETDFIKHKFTIKDKSVIDKLVSNNIKYVFIEDTGSIEKKAVEVLTAGIIDDIGEIIEKPEFTRINIEEYERAEDIYKVSLKIVRNVLEDVRAGKMFNSGAVKNVAENIAELTMRHKGVLSSVTKLKKHDDYTFQHSMNVSVYAASLAAHLGMDKAEVERIANAGILHDVGKMFVPSDVLNKPGKLTDDEFAVMKQHVQYGYDFLKKQGLPPDMLRLAYEHHERYDGSGYPQGLKDSDISIEGKIGAVVDIYDAITSDRVYHKGMEAPSALKLMFKWADSHINKKIFEFFVMNIGIYPVGSLILMSNNELAVVAKTNINKPTQPVVLVFADAKGGRIPLKAIDLSKNTVKEHRIMGPVNPEKIDIPQEIYTYIDNLNKIV
jgi:putative nucleotidyltransferase with HDIG domain